MSLPEPAWRIKTRPCPFYQKGHCVFSTSCNFLHTSNWPINNQERSEQGLRQEPPTTPVKPPVISIESPHSTRSNRSPRLSGLLLALRDVIGDDPTDGLLPGLPPSSPAINNSWSASSSTLVNDSTSYNPGDTPECSASSYPSTIFTSPQKDPLFSNRQSLFHENGDDGSVNSDSDSPVLPDTTSENNTLHIDTLLSQNEPRVCVINGHSVDEEAVEEVEGGEKEEGAEDEEEEEYVEPVYAITRDDILSPVEFAEMQLANFSQLGPPPEPLVEPIDPIDREVEYSYRPSAQSILSPPRSPNPTSTFELLSSPFGALSNRVFSPTMNVFFRRYSGVPEEENIIHAPCDSDLDSPQPLVYETQNQEERVLDPFVSDVHSSQQLISDTQIEEGIALEHHVPELGSSPKLTSGTQSQEETHHDASVYALQQPISETDTHEETALGLYVKMDSPLLLNHDAQTPIETQKNAHTPDLSPPPVSETFSDEETAGDFHVNKMDSPLQPVFETRIKEEISHNAHICDLHLPQQLPSGTQPREEITQSAYTSDLDSPQLHIVEAQAQEELVNDVRIPDTYSPHSEARIHQETTPELHVNEMDLPRQLLSENHTLEEVSPHVHISDLVSVEELVSETQIQEQILHDDHISNADSLGSVSETMYQEEILINPHISYMDSPRQLNSHAQSQGKVPTPPQAPLRMTEHARTSQVELNQDADVAGVIEDHEAYARWYMEEEKELEEQEEANEQKEDDQVEMEYSFRTEGNITAVFVGRRRSAQQEVRTAIKRSSQTPLHFLESLQLEFDVNETSANSSVSMETQKEKEIGIPPIASAISSSPDRNVSTVSEDAFILSPEDYSGEPLHILDPESSIFHEEPIEDDQMDISRYSSSDHTARLAYIDSPSDERVERSSSLRSFYDTYAVFSPYSSHAQALNVDVHDNHSADVTTREPSSISTPASLVYSRAFTPPSLEGRNRAQEQSYTIDSPLLSRRQDSPMSEQGLASPFTIQPMRNSLLKNQSPPSAGTSRQVPFAWRNSLTSSHTSRRTSLSVARPLIDTLRDSKLGQTSPSLSSSPPSPAPTGLKPLRLSTIISAQLSSSSSRDAPAPKRNQSGRRGVSMSPTAVSSSQSSSRFPSLSSARFSHISSRTRNSLISSEHHIPSPLASENFTQLSNFGPMSAPISSSHIWRRASIYSQDESSRAPSRLSEPTFRTIDEEDDDNHELEYHNEQVYNRISQTLPTPPPSAITNTIRQPTHAISTPKPTLMFAIASDNVKEVKRVLENGDARPNDVVGPQTALEFALTNEQLINKTDIVKTLLAYGADPSGLKRSSSLRRSSLDPTAAAPPPVASLIDDSNAALKYYVERADAPHTRRTSALIHRSFFRPLTRVRYELVGQDCALEQLFRVLSMQSRGISVAPIVVLLCGPSGHGKSLLARKFGSLLDVPTHTVNMTTLKSTHDLWQSHSMSPYEVPTTCTLAEFLINNEGKRCVVVLDEIEKTDEKTLWSLLMPWELGRCSFEAGSRHIDVRNVVWLGTSNIGHDLVFKHQDSRVRPNELMAREEYVELMGLMRPLVSERLGASVLSRVTTVLPFVPFTLEEKRALCSEALYTLGGEDARSLSAPTVESMIQSALTSYCAGEGARSLHRAMSSQLMEIL